MSRDERKSLRVGVLVLVAVGLLIAGTFLVGREQQLWERRVDYEIRFKRINGLRSGSAVTLTGVDIGSVQEVSLPEDPNASYIRVRISVVRQSASRIRDDTVAHIRTVGLLGDKFIELSAGSPSSALRPPGSIIPAVDPIDYEELLGESGDIVTNIVEVTNSLKDVFAAIDRGEGLLGQMLRNRAQGAATLEDLQRSFAHLESTTAAVDRIAHDVESGKGALGVLLKRGDQVERLLDRLGKASAALQSLTSRLERANGALPRLLEDRQYGERLLADLHEAARNLADLAEKANRGKGTLGKLVNDPGLYENADALVTQARTSWLFYVYRGIRGLFPPYAPEHAFPTPAPTPAPTPRPPRR